MALTRPIIRPATRADLDRFYKDKYPFTATAIVGLVRGRIVGCGGVGFVGGKLVAFCDLKPTARRYKIALVKAASGVIAAAKANGAKFIWTEADPNEPGAVRWITSLGFRPTNHPRIFRWSRD